ncbi:hypothetical protein ACOMHN_051009 [Nucella lapillus]
MSGADADEHEKSRWLEVMSSPGQVPCVRRSFLTGITTGLGIGAASFFMTRLGISAAFFFMTSNVKRSTNIGFGSYILVTAGSWLYCRYSLAQERVKQRHLKKALQQRIASEGIKDQTQDV